MLGKALKIMEELFTAGQTLTGVTVIVHSTNRDGQAERNLFCDVDAPADRHAIEAAWLLELARGGAHSMPVQESS